MKTKISFAVIIFAASITLLSTSQAFCCEKNVIYVAHMENRAIQEYDRYWGYPEDFSKTVTYMIAFRLMYETGKTIKILDASETSLFGSDEEELLNVDNAKKLPGVGDGCYIVAGIISEAVVDTSRSLKLAIGRKKFDIYSTMQLAMADVSTGKVLVSDGYLGKHETSTMPNDLINRDRRQFFPTDPVEAGGNALGIPFSRISFDFARSVKQVIAD
jgi:hypothetical protein